MGTFSNGRKQVAPIQTYAFIDQLFPISDLASLAFLDLALLSHQSASTLIINSCCFDCPQASDSKQDGSRLLPTRHPRSTLHGLENHITSHRRCCLWNVCRLRRLVDDAFVVANGSVDGAGWNERPRINWPC